MSTALRGHLLQHFSRARVLLDDLRENIQNQKIPAQATLRTEEPPMMNGRLLAEQFSLFWWQSAPRRIAPRCIRLFSFETGPAFSPLLPICSL